jgi:hypothetical protein
VDLMARFWSQAWVTGSNAATTATPNSIRPAGRAGRADGLAAAHRRGKDPGKNRNYLDLVSRSDSYADEVHFPVEGDVAA